MNPMIRKLHVQSRNDKGPFVAGRMCHADDMSEDCAMTIPVILNQVSKCQHDDVLVRTSGSLSVENAFFMH